ncbi:unnamed protein product [Orchesella dallaii]
MQNEDEDEGGGIAGSIELGRAEIVKGVLPLEEDESIVPEQRVSGGRLFIQNGRDFYTKVMSNGVGVIVRGQKTAHIGFDKTPILPHRVSNRPITLPAHTVSRQFHLIESPGRPLNNAISHLLHSIVRSATPDLVTKTMLTTFTYLTTVLRHSNTIIKSREETISNVLTQKFRPTIEYTPSVKAEPSSLPPELLASLTGSSSYFTNTLTTTYIYYNTFTIDSLPVILTSRETVSNVVTLPVYMSPTMVDLMATGSRVFETETYFTTYTFSKTLLPDDSTESEKVVTTKEIITQVVVTEALAPPTSQAPMNTPVPPGMLLDEITKTYFTTFTHLFTEIDDSGQMIVRSSTRVSSEVVTETLTPTDSTETITPDSLYKMKLTAQPTFTGFIGGMKPSLMNNHITLRSPSTLLPTRSDQIQFTTIQPSETVDMEPKTLEPVMIYATKTYYTTYTYFTTVLGDGSSIRATIHSRTQIVSKIVTEALSTSFDAYYLNALKSSYLSKYSTMIDITSSVREVTPAKTLDGTERPGTLMTQSVSEPHWPKDNDELAFEIDGTTVNSITGVEVPNNENDSPVQAEIQVSSASSEEHFDEMKDEINKIVNVLTEAQGSEESPTSDLLSPSSTQEPIYSTVAAFTPDTMLMSSEVVNFDDGVAYVESVTFKEPSSYYTFPEEIITEHMYVATEKPITHMPTPPLLSSSPVQPLTTMKPKTKKPFNPYLSHTDIEMFPDIGTPQKSVIIDLPPDIHEYSDEDMNNKDQYMSLLLGDRYPHSTSILAKRTGTILFDPPVTPTFSDPSAHILSLVSQLADEQHWADYDEGNKDVSKEDEIVEPNIYKISTTFDSFQMPTQMVQVPMKSPTLEIFGNATKVGVRGTSTKNATGADKQEDGGDMKIHNLSDDDFLSDGSGSGSGEGELVEEVTVQDGVVEDVDTEIDRETDHTANPDADGVEEEEIELEGFSKTTESSVPPFPPRTRYTTSQKPNKKKKKTQKPIFGAEQASREDESGESSTKVYSLKVPHLDLLGGGDSVSEESENNSDNKKESEQENDDQSSESVERPQDDGGGGYQGPGPSKSSVSYPSLGPGIISAPGSGPVASTSKIDWKPLLKLGAIGLGGLGASSLTKLAPWFNSMAGSFMKGSLLPLARNDTSPSHSNTYVRNVNGRPIFYRNPPNDGSLIQHSDPVYIPVGGLDDEQDDRIQRRPITSHAKEPNLRPVSLERDHYPPGRGHSPSFEVGPDLNFPPKHNFNFKPPNDHQPNIYSQMSDLNLHKNGEFSLHDPNLRLINGMQEMGTAASDLPMEGKTDFILRPIQNIMNGRPMYDAPKPGPIIPLRQPPHRQFQSGEITKVQRPNFRPQEHNRPEHNHNQPEHTDAINDIPDNPRKPIPEIPLLRPVPPTDGIILPHRNRDHNQNRHPSNTDILHAFKHPFIPPPRINQNQNSNEQWPKPLAPFRNSGEQLHNPNQGFDDITNMRPPLPPSENNQDQFGQRPFGHAGFPPNPFEAHRPMTAEASEENENVFTDIFGVRPSNDERDSPNGQDISFHPHNAGEGPFRPIETNDEDSPHNRLQHPHNPGEGPFRPIQTNDEDSPHNRLQHPPQFNLKNPGYQPNLPQPHPTGIAGQPSDQFGNREEDLSHEESSESPFHHDFKKLSPPRKPSWPPKNSNAPMSYSYFEDLSNHNSDGRPGINDDASVAGAPVENEIPPQHSHMHTPPTHNMQNFPPAPPLAYPPTKHIPPHRQRPSTVYIVQQEEMDAHTTTSTPSPINYTPAASEHHEHEQDVQESSNGVTTPFPKLIIKEIPTRPVAPYYRRSTTTPGPLQTPTNRATIAKLFIRRFSTTTPLPTTTIPYEEDTTQNRIVTWRPRIRPSYVSTTTTTPEPPPTTPEHRRNSNANTNSNSSDTIIDSWLVSPTVNDLQDFLEDFKTKFATDSNNGDVNNNNNNPLLSTADKKSDSNSPNIILPQKFSTQSSPSTTPEPPYDDDDDGDLDSAEYDDDEEDELSIGASSETNSTNGGHHPNHHPIHKDPIDADHFFSTGQGDFAQYYSGTEDRDTIIDPVNQQVIKSPFDDHRRNVSHIINRYRATSSSTTRPIRPIHFRNHTANTADLSQEENNAGGDDGGVVEGLTISLPNGAFGSIPIENEIADLPGPTTYRPRFDVTFHNKMGTTSEEPASAPNPTTFRGDIMKPTTFRPGPDDLPPIGNRVRPDPTRDQINARPPSPSSSTTKRPAPQAGMASFYDDEESLDQLKMKNKEIHKLPTVKKPNTLVPDVLEVLSDEDYGSLEKLKSSSSTTTSPKSSKEKGNDQKKGEEYEEGEYSEEYDSSYDDDGYIEIPPAGFPSKSDYAPAQSGLKNSAEGKQNSQYIPNAPLAHPTVQPQSRRPGPLEMITNFFRRPPVRPPPRMPNQQNGPQPQHPGGPGRIPFMPNREPTRTMMPPKNSKERPELEFQANNFNPNVKTIPLNPNSVEKDKVHDPIVLMPKDSTDNPSYTTTISPRESGEKTTLNTPSIIIEEDKNDQASQTSDATAVTVNPNSNGHRESTYVEDSEYYEDDEMEQEDKNNVISPDEESHGPNPTVPPIQFQPHLPPQPQPSQPLNKPHLLEHRPINIGGHLVNGNPFGRPPIANQQRPPPGFIPGRRPLPPFLRPNPNGRPPIANIFNPPPNPPPQQHNVNTQLPPVAQNEPLPPRTEMEPPPIDSNRLKAPILELPSSGPIRYRPINNLHRPNLLRPDDDLFKPTTKVSKTVHTIASVDDLNKIVATNTFTAILPSRDSDTDSPIEPTPTSSTSATENTDPTEIHLEGSESSVVVPSKSTGATIKMTSVVKYTGGRLETSEIEAQAASDAPSTNSISSSESTVTHIRGPNIIIPTRASSTQTSTSTSSSTPNNRLIGLNRRPPFIGRPITTTEDPEPVSTITNDNNTTNNSSSTVRVTVTMESSVSSEITELSPTTNRRPFIPTRTPVRNTNFPWLRKTSTVATTTTEKVETTTPVATTTTSSKPTTSFPPRMRGPSITTSEPKETGGFSTTLRLAPSIFNISRNSNRPEILRRPTIVPPRISAPVTRPSSKASGESIEISSKTSSTESKERPALVFPRLTTFKPPFRRPALNFASSKSRERFTTTLINKITTSGTPPPSRNTSVFSKVLNNTNVNNSSDATSSANVSTTTTSPQSESSEYEYSDEEYEDEDFELDGGSSSPVPSDSTTTTGTPTTTTTVSTVNITTINGTRSMVTSTSSSTSVSTSMSVGNETKVITVSSSEISPTRVSNRGNKQKGILNTMVLRGSMSKVPEVPPTTRYITHSDTDTKTLTETETTVHVTAGTPYTHTIMITKTIPPQTLVSTIVGSVTLVNSIDVRPTTVRSTIISEPTKEVYSFVDTSEATDDNVVERVTTEKVMIGGILTVGNFPRPTPRPTTTSTRKEPTTTTTTKEPKMVRNRPIHIDSGCPANCTTQGNQACRPYANGTKYKCECKPGYARLKRKFPCRPTYTYEVTLAINHMDGMSFDFKDLQNSATNAYLNFITVSKEAVDKAFLSTDIKRQFQGSEIMKLRPINAVNEKTKTPEPKVYVDFLVQLTANVTEDRIRNHLIRTLKSSNFSIGRTGITSTKNMSDFEARDFNECLYSEFNDCSPNAECLNVRGSYSCRCRAGFRDKSPKKHKPGRDCFEMQGCPECNYKGHCRINGYGEPFCECFRWFGGSKCHINLKILLFAIMGVVAILFIFVLLCSVLVCRRTKIHRERPGSGRFMRYRSPTSQATLDRAAIMNDSASSDGRQSPPRINTSFTPDSLLVEGDPKQANNLRVDSLMGMAPDNVHLMNFSLRNVIMDQDRSLTVVIPRAKIRPPSRPPSIHATLGPDPNADLAATERKLINYLDHSPYPPAPYPTPRPPPTSGSRQSTIKRHDSRQFRKLSLQEQRKISSGALVSSGTEVSARGGMRRRSIGPEPEPTYSGYEK